MNKNWLELESDPGLFTLLLEDIDFSPTEQLWDMIARWVTPMTDDQQIDTLMVECPVYGFIFLFRWIEERRSRRKVNHDVESFVIDDSIVNNIFFAHQVIQNSCATHALLSVLLNCDQVNLGETLSKLKVFCHGMNPQNKGVAIGNLPDLKRHHNSYSRPEPRQLQEKQTAVSTGKAPEAFHFVSYVPINGRLFELDGLKPYPIDHGPWSENEEWTEKFYRVITDRLGIATGGEPYHDIRFNLMSVVPDRRQQEPYHDIRFNLMSVVPDRRQQYELKLSTLKTNRQIVLDALQQLLDARNKMVKMNNEAVEQSLSRNFQGDKKTTSNVSGPLLVTKDDLKDVGKNDSLSQENTNSTANLTSKGDTNDEKCSLSKEGVDLCNKTMEKSEKSTENSIDLTQEPDISVDSAQKPVESTQKSHMEKLQDLTADSTHKPHTHSSSEKSQDSLNDNSAQKPHCVMEKSQDLNEPLSIETKVDGERSGGETTDTASEVGSSHQSPVVTCGDGKAPSTSTETWSTRSERSTFTAGDFQVGINRELKVTTECAAAITSACSPNTRSKFSCQYGFTPKNLLDLLKNVEKEIKTCESKLRDEVEKRKKYKIDHCRRTHSYDQFVFTFLSMLAQQGQLSDLVNKHTLVKRRHGQPPPEVEKKRRTRYKRKR